MATQGTAIINFGAFPGASDASVFVPSAAIGSGSLVEAWLSGNTASADHSIDEHLAETIKIVACDIVAGIGFTIRAFNTNQVSEPFSARSRISTLQEPRLYGQFNVNWVWN